MNCTTYPQTPHKPAKPASQSSLPGSGTDWLPIPTKIKHPRVLLPIKAYQACRAFSGRDSVWVSFLRSRSTSSTECDKTPPSFWGNALVGARGCLRWRLRLAFFCGIGISDSDCAIWGRVVVHDDVPFRCVRLGLYGQLMAL